MKNHFLYLIMLKNTLCHKIVFEYRKNHLGFIKKTVDDIYKDDKFYYVVDSFIGSTKRKAFTSGLKVDGVTGVLYDPRNETNTKNTKLITSP